MSYAKKLGSADLLQNSSFTVSLSRDDDLAWGATEHGVFIMTDEQNVEIINQPMVKSDDDLTLTFQVDSSESVDLLGKYRILAWQRDTNDPNINVPIADYSLNYETTKAGE